MFVNLNVIIGLPLMNIAEGLTQDIYSSHGQAISHSKQHESFTTSMGADKDFYSQ